jgi:Mrp family chromosome partitioning ATPase
MDRLARLASFQLLVVTGKGGVGKSAVAASLGRLLARAGRQVLVLEVDPRENLHQMLGVAPSGGAVVAAGGGLWVQNLKPGQVLDDIVRERLKIEMLARRVLASPIYQQFSAGAPGLAELAILGHALRLLRHAGDAAAPRLDLVVLDAPATGHGVRLLTAPRLVADVIHGGPFGALAGELAAFVADPGRCGIVVVTQAEEMPVEEALDLRQALGRQLDRQPELLVVNGLYPPLPAAPAAPAVGAEPAAPRLAVAAAPAVRAAPGAAAEPAVPASPAGAGSAASAAQTARAPGVADAGIASPDDLLALWRQRRALNERELARLAAVWEGPRVDLQQLPLERGPALTEALAARLDAGLQAAAATPSQPAVPTAAANQAGTAAAGDLTGPAATDVPGEAP